MRSRPAPGALSRRFRILEYALAGDCLAAQRRPHLPHAEFRHPPLVVLNNFGGQEEHHKLTTTMIQNMFPAINVRTVRLSGPCPRERERATPTPAPVANPRCAADVRRCVLFSYDSSTDTIEFRHYVITASPTGLSRNVRRLVKASIPDLGKLEDIRQVAACPDAARATAQLIALPPRSEYVLGGGAASESEAEDGDDSKVTLSQVRCLPLARPCGACLVADTGLVALPPTRRRALAAEGTAPRASRPCGSTRLDRA